jgi:WD40 repeat protein
MWLVKQFLLLFVFSFGLRTVVAQALPKFPPPDAILADTKHKEPKSGVQLGPGNALTIQSGVGTPTTINALAFSRDSKLLAAGKDFGRVVVWDVPNRKFLCALDTGQGIVTAVAISSDGQLLVTGGQGDHFRLKLWHLPDGKLLRTYDYFGGYVHTAAFGPDSAWIVVWANDVKTHVLDATTGKQLLELNDMFSPLLSPGGDILVTVSKTDFTLWNTTDWTKQRTLPRSPAYAIPLALNPKANSFVVTSSGTFRLERLSTGELLPNLPNPELPKFNLSAGGFAAFGANSHLFGHSDDRLWAWDSSTGATCVSEFMYSESGSLSPDGTLLAGAKDNSIFTQTRSGNGVWIWDTSKLLSKCFSAAGAAPSPKNQLQWAEQ